MALERLSSAAAVGAPGRVAVLRPGAAAPAMAAATALALSRLDPLEPLLRLRFTTAFDGSLWARGPEGQQVQIPASALAGQRWEPGQLLLVRVVGSTPQLELAVLGPAEEGMASTLPRSAGDASLRQPAQQTPALQADQAGIHRLLLAPLQVPALATQWRNLVLTQLRQAAPGQAVPTPLHPPPGGLQRPDVLALVGSGEGPAQSLQGLLVFHTLLWPGVWLTFWPMPARARAAGQRGGAGQRLRLELDLPGLGPVRLDLELHGHAVALLLSADAADAVPLLHSRATLAAASLARSHLRLLHWQVVHSSPLPPTVPLPASPAPGARTDLALPPGLFRAAAEVLSALSPPFR